MHATVNGPFTGGAAGGEWWAETPLDEMHWLINNEPYPNQNAWRTACGKLIILAWDQESYPVLLLECLWCLYEESDAMEEANL